MGCCEQPGFILSCVMNGVLLIYQVKTSYVIKVWLFEKRISNVVFPKAQSTGRDRPRERKPILDRAVRTAIQLDVQFHLELALLF